MATDIKPIKEFFPLIDDPANIFYSKLKTFFCSLAPSYLHVNALDRVHREILIHLPFTDHVWKIKEDIRKIPNEVLEGLRNDQVYNGYALLQFKKINITSTEITNSGELIPVNEYSLGIHNIYNHLYYFQSPEKVIFVGESPEYITIGLRVSRKLYCNSNIYVDFTPVDNTLYKENYLSVYKPLIGRKIHFIKSESSWSWDLYDIDSDYREILIDSSSVDYSSDTYNEYSCNSCSFNKHWPITYGPSMDHPASLTFCKSVDSDHIDSIYEANADEYTITVMEKAFAKDQYPADIRMYNDSELYIDERGLSSYEDLQTLFSKIRVGYQKRRYSLTSNYRRLRAYYKEELLLALCFILNINFRFLYNNIGSLDALGYLVLRSTVPEITFRLANRIETEDSRTITIPSNLQPTPTPYGDIASMYFYEPFGDSTSSVVSGVNIVPLVQNALGYEIRSAFDRFRSANADLFYNINSALKVYNPYVDNGFMNSTPHIMTLKDYIANLNFLTSNVYCSTSSIFMEVI